jgi:FixJ family two-component response regulator
MSDNCTVYLVDDDASVLRALSRLLRAEGIETLSFSSPQAFLDVHDPALPGCAVVDMAMPGVDGLNLQRELAAAETPRPVIFLSGRSDIPTSVKAMKAGAVDFLTKPVSRDALLAAVRSALARDAETRAARARVQAWHSRYASLTPREREVFAGVVAGKLNKQIAAELGTAERTVKAHRAQVMEKMQVASLAELVHVAEQLHAAVPPPLRAAPR